MHNFFFLPWESYIEIDPSSLVSKPLIKFSSSIQNITMSVCSDIVTEVSAIDRSLRSDRQVPVTLFAAQMCSRYVATIYPVLWPSPWTRAYGLKWPC